MLFRSVQEHLMIGCVRVLFRCVQGAGVYVFTHGSILVRMSIARRICVAMAPRLRSDGVGVLNAESVFFKPFFCLKLSETRLA